MNKGAVLAITFVAAACYTAVDSHQETQSVAQGVGLVPLPPWPAGDERGMAIRRAMELAFAAR
jgi:hypothetical protein